MSVTIHRWALAAAICGIGAAAALAQSPSLAGDAVRATAPAVPTLNIGVRYDAPPFSYSDPRLIEAPAQRQRGADAAPGDGSDPGYRGYVVQICRSILADMPEQQGWTSDNVVFVEINAQNRFEMLRNAEIDILCDPATITRDRLARSDRPLMASLPIYMSAVTFAAPRTPPLKDQCQSIVGVVSETTAFLPGLRRIIDAGNWPRHAAQVRKALISANFDAPVLPDSDCVEVVIKRYRTHDELAEDFCKGDTLYYVGDIEIIRSMIVRQGCDERTTIAPAEFTVERYAIYTRLPEDDPTKSLLILGFLAELTRQVQDENRSLLVEVFEDVFLSGKNLYPASTTLRTFFWILTGDTPRTP